MSSYHLVVLVNRSLDDHRRMGLALRALSRGAGLGGAVHASGLSLQCLVSTLSELADGLDATVDAQEELDDGEVLDDEG